MIDFRYHLVSLASVLIALAIGIVLGAGPLKEGISESLSKQVVQLRTEKQQLRTDLDSAESSIDTHENFEKAMLPAAVSGRLTDRTVVVVTLPGADSSITSSSEDTLGSAGAALQTPVQIAEKWADPAAADERATLATALQQTLALPSTATGDTLLNQVLGATLLTTAANPSVQPTISVDQRRLAWEALREAGFVSGGFPSTVGNLALIIGAPESAVATATASGSGDPLAAYAALAGALDAAGAGAVLASQINPEASQATSVVAAARGESSLRQQLSTVDDAQGSIGQVSIVLALVEQAAGRAGQYGRLPGARAAFPTAG